MHPDFDELAAILPEERPALLAALAQREANRVRSNTRETAAIRESLTELATALGCDPVAMHAAFDDALYHPTANGSVAQAEEAPPDPISTPTLEAADEMAHPTLPVIFAPGTQATPDGTMTQSQLTFCEDATRLMPPDALLFRYGDVLGTLDGEPGLRRFRPTCSEKMRLLVDKYMRVFSTRRTEAGIVQSYQPCKQDLGRLLHVHCSTSTIVPSLRLLTSHPVYLPGFDLSAPGYNVKGQVFYDAPPFLSDITPLERPFLPILSSLFEDFPLKDDASRAGIIAYMLTRLIRPALESAAPFFFVQSSRAGTGKGFLIDCASMAISGERCPRIEVGPKEEERRKALVGVLRGGSSAIHIDNVPTGVPYDSASTASLATGYPDWSARILGESRVDRMPNNVTVCLSGNNPSATGEIARRCVPIVLVSKDDHPELRFDFLHPNFEAWALECRVPVLSCLVGMVEAWKAAGRPMSETVRMGSFESWARTVGGIFEVAGIPGLLANFVEWQASADDFEADAMALLEALSRKYSGGEFKTADVMAVAVELGVFSKYMTVPTENGKAQQFARWVLIPLKDRPTGSYILRRRSAGSNGYYSVGLAFAS